MKRVDTHVHTEYSNEPSEWFLRQTGMNESYVPVEEAYRLAKSNGMDYVVITDHNTIDGALALNKLHPEDTFIGVEVTTEFPENGCKMHILVFDITEEQFAHIQKIRGNIYTFRDYIIAENIAYSVAHATFAVNCSLSMEVLEKLILMFDVFEGINGARNPYFNESWMKALTQLTPADIARLYAKYKIAPMSPDPWIKGFTGGTDDHAALYIGETWTGCEANSKEEFIQKLKDKKTFASGRHNDFKGMAYTFSKILHQASENGLAKKKDENIFKIVSNLIFNGSRPSMKQSYGIHRMKFSRKKKNRILAKFIDQLDTDLQDIKDLHVEDKIDCIYDNLSNLCDDLLKHFVTKSQKDIAAGDLFKFVNSISSLLPIAYLTAPFATTSKLLNQDRELLEEFRSQYIEDEPNEGKRVYWFTDTLIDLNGVSVTINNMYQCAKKYNVGLKIVTSNPNITVEDDLKDEIINLPTITSIKPGFYETYTLHIPSILKSIEKICELNPDEIIISTPGTVGLIGLLAAKILGIKCTGIYHSDFGAQANYLLGSGFTATTVEKYTHWFYKQLDKIRVPTHEYIDILSAQGFEGKEMKKFKRGINTDLFAYNTSFENEVRKKYGIKDGFTMIYAGRVSKDKSVDFLSKIYKGVCRNYKKANLIVAGNGPELEWLKEDLKDYPRVVFTGSIERTELTKLYSFADLLVFPSTTDTFGMVVLEAQSCGLPALVSDQGGPQEIIKKRATGQVIPANNLYEWIGQILEFIYLCDNHPDKYMLIRKETRNWIKDNYSWEKALEDLLNVSILPEGPSRPSRISLIDDPVI